MGRPALTERARATEAERFRVLVTVGTFEPGSRGGGPIRSVANIMDAVSAGTEVSLVTRDRDFGSSEPYAGLSGRWVTRGQARVFYLDTRSLRQWLRLRRQLMGTRFDLLYVNSLWDPLLSVIPIVAAGLGLVHVRKVLIAPRGEFSPGALAIKSPKKSFFLRLWAFYLRRRRVVWHAFTAKEASEIKAAIPWAQILVNQNQVSLPHEPLAVAPASAGPARLVFIGRISAKKNLALTLTALRRVSRPVEFDIYGPLEDRAYWSACEVLIRQLPSHVSAKYRRELAPGEVRATFAEYDFFVFPTLGENFGHAIAESLSASCPVLCSAETPWTRVLETGGGTVIRDLTAERLGRELERLAALTPQERLAAKYAAGRAYGSWRKQAVGPNILEEVRESWSNVKTKQISPGAA